MPNKPWEKATRARKEERKRRKTLLFCEDTKSSVFYLEAFPIDESRFELQVRGTGMNTDSLVEEAIKFLKVEDRKRQLYNDVWCVMDRDSFPLDRYIRAFQLAVTNNIRIAWANEAFELWYLMHFDYVDSALSRESFSDRLALRGLTYDKTDKLIYEKLKDKQEVAIRNAGKLKAYWNSLNERFPERHNPSTNIEDLIEVLGKLAQLPPAEPAGAIARAIDSSAIPSMTAAAVDNAPE